MASGPGIISKGMLTTGRIVQKPFHIPMDMTTSSLAVGGAVHNTVGKTSMAVAESLASLDPKGPAKWAVQLLGQKIPEAVGKSAGRAEKATNVFWKPVSEASLAVGHAIATPLALPYAVKAGFPTDQATIAALLDSKGYPMPAPPEQAGGGQQAAPAPAPQAAPEGQPQAAPPQQ